METIISPILLKAYTVMRDCECRPEIMDRVEGELRGKLERVRGYRAEFNAKMEGLLRAAEAKEHNVMRQLFKESGRSACRDNKN